MPEPPPSAAAAAPAVVDDVAVATAAVDVAVFGVATGLANA
jgi:hypothetical protein